MKKSVLLFIGVVFVAAILVIGFFGMEQVVYKEITYVQSIECTNEGITYVNGIGYVLQLDSNESEIILEYKLITADGSDPTNSNVKFIYDTQTAEGFVEVTSLGAVIFKSTGGVYVTIKSVDAKGASVTVFIVKV